MSTATMLFPVRGTNTAEVEATWVLEVEATEALEVKFEAAAVMSNEGCSKYSIAASWLPILLMFALLWHSSSAFSAFWPALQQTSFGTLPVSVNAYDRAFST
jgi:hypothetical protein